MTPTPDEDYDAVLYQCRHPWTVWLVGELLGGRGSLTAGLELARAVAAVHRKPAWLLDEIGYPLQPITPRIH